MAAAYLSPGPLLAGTEQPAPGTKSIAWPTQGGPVLLEKVLYHLDACRDNQISISPRNGSKQRGHHLTDGHNGSPFRVEFLAFFFVVASSIFFPPTK